MAVEVLLPKLGLTMQEGTISEWLVPAGTEVRPGDVLMRLETDKVDADVEAEAEGRFHPVVPAGATLAPGTLIGWLLAVDEQVPAGGAAPGGAEDVPAAAADAPPPAGGSEAPTPAAPGRLRVSPNARRVARERGIDLTLVSGTGPGGRVVSEDVETVAADGRVSAGVPGTAAPASAPAPSAPAPAPAPSAPAPASPLAAAGPAAAPGRYVSPLVRRHAETLGVDLSAVNGTGVGGRVRRRDVDEAASLAPPQPAPQTPQQPEPEPRPAVAGPRPGQVIPLRGMRGAIARGMHASLQEMAQLTHGYEADVTELVALRAQLKREWYTPGGQKGPRVPSLNDFVVRAAALALLDHPLLNATIRDDAVHLLAEVHVGVAVAVPDGLLVPVVRDAASRGLLDLSAETRRLADAARAGQLELPDLEGGTFTVSSLGSYGVDFFTPVINRPNVAILGVGRVRDGVRWEGDTPLRTSVLTLSLTFDHRAVDGAPAAEYLRTLTALLARPLMLLAG